MSEGHLGDSSWSPGRDWGLVACRVKANTCYSLLLHVLRNLKCAFVGAFVVWVLLTPVLCECECGSHQFLNCVKFWVQIAVGCCLIVKPAALWTAVWGCDAGLGCMGSGMGWSGVHWQFVCWEFVLS